MYDVLLFQSYSLHSYSELGGVGAPNSLGKVEANPSLDRKESSLKIGTKLLFNIHFCIQALKMIVNSLALQFLKIKILTETDRQTDSGIYNGGRRLR